MLQLGGQRPEWTIHDRVALRIYNALANGMGGIDWQGLPLMVALHQVDDVEVLVERLLTIKYHRPPTEH